MEETGSCVEDTMQDVYSGDRVLIVAMMPSGGKAGGFGDRYLLAREIQGEHYYRIPMRIWAGCVEKRC